MSTTGKAESRLQLAVELLDKHALPAARFVADRAPTGSELQQQFSNKLQILQRLRAHAVEAESQVASFNSKTSHHTLTVMLRRLDESFEANSVPKEEIAEFHRFGLRNFFDILFVEEDVSGFAYLHAPVHALSE